MAQLPASSGALYYAEDMLGNSRVMVQANGTLYYDADFTNYFSAPGALLIRALCE